MAHPQLTSEQRYQMKALMQTNQPATIIAKIVAVDWSRAGAKRLLPIQTSIMSSRFDKMWQAAYNPPPN